MQLASHGGRVASRNLNALLQESSFHTGAVNRSTDISTLQRHSGTNTRGLHISSFAQGAPRTSAPGTAQKLLSQTRTLLNRFFTHLTTPGTIGHPSAPSIARSFQGAARGQASIQSGLSFPVRTALSRPLSVPFLPRPPAIPRCTTQVGLGAARNFSSARPIFQNLVENVPIAGRAFWEADWEIKTREERARMIQKPLKRKHRKDGGKEMMKPKLEAISLEEQDLQQKPEQTTYDAEMKRYFTASPVANFTTYLLVPLAPTPTSRLPLLEFTPSNPTLLPFSALGSLHASHTTHALRVSSLFSRLDTANVWTRNVSCSAYSHGTAAGKEDGTCTVLEVEFVGWTMAEVRAVVGESATGWCVLEERRTDEAADSDDASSVLSGMSSEVGDVGWDWATNGDAREIGPMEDMELYQSFILPTLDFSSSSIGATSPPPPSNEWITDADFDMYDSGSDISSPSSIEDSSSAGSWLLQYPPDPISRNSSWFGFSSDFTSRVSNGYEPRENLF